MRFFRLLSVVLLVTLSGGVLGGLVGGLLGYAVPSSISAAVDVERKGSRKDDVEAVSGSQEHQAKVGLGIGSAEHSSKAREGAALGGAFGLVIGGGCGVIVGILDQILLVIYSWTARKPEGPAPPRP